MINGIEGVVDGKGSEAWMYQIALGALGSVIVFLATLCGKLAKLVYDGQRERLQDRKDRDNEVGVMEESLRKRKGASP